MLAYRYVDPTAGPSAKGAAVSAAPTPQEVAAAVGRPDRTFRQPDAFGARALDAVEVRALGLPNPLQVTAAYLAERARWALAPCDVCGADQGFDPPSVMARTRFPQLRDGDAPVMFTAHCACGGTMALAALDAPAEPSR